MPHLSVAVVEEVDDEVAVAPADEKTIADGNCGAAVGDTGGNCGTAGLPPPKAP